MFSLLYFLARGYQIFKILVCTPHNTPLIMEVPIFQNAINNAKCVLRLSKRSACAALGRCSGTQRPLFLGLFFFFLSFRVAYFFLRRGCPMLWKFCIGSLFTQILGFHFLDPPYPALCYFWPGKGGKFKSCPWVPKLLV